MLMTPTDYARAIGVAPSTISRAIARGRIPVVTDSSGKRLVDRQAADAARRLDCNIRAGHGGRPDRAARRQSIWKARSSNGYDPASLALLNVMVREFPLLMKDAMAILGADEINQARAVVALDELTHAIACSAHHEFNDGRVYDYRTPLPERPALDWSAYVQAFVDKVGDDGNGARWTSDDVEGLPGGSEWLDRSVQATEGVRP